MITLLWPEGMRKRKIPPRDVAALTGSSTRNQLQDISRHDLQFIYKYALDRQKKTSYRSWTVGEVQQYIVYLDARKDLNSASYARAFAGLDGEDHFWRGNQQEPFWYDYRGVPTKENPDIVPDDFLLVAYLSDHNPDLMMRGFSDSHSHRISDFKYPTGRVRSGPDGLVPYEVTRLYTYNISAMQRRLHKGLLELYGEEAS